MRITLVFVALFAACGPASEPPADAETPTFTPCATSAQCVGSPSPHRAAPACVRGQCLRLCDTGWADCDGVAANGCEHSTADGGFCP